MDTMKSTQNAVASREAIAVEQKIEAYQYYLSWMHSSMEVLNKASSISEYVASDGHYVSVTIYCDRESMKDMLSLKHGNWNKTMNQWGAEYHTEIEDWVLNCDGEYIKLMFSVNTDLPPTCRVEYEEQIVPAQPERTIKKAIVKCDGKVMD